MKKKLGDIKQSKVVESKSVKPKQLQPILIAENLTKYYSKRKSPAISNVNIKVMPGEFHAFIGSNGAGKTTTIKTLIGAYHNWTGKVLIQGMKNTSEGAKAKIGYIPETARFPAKFSALEYLESMMRLSKIPKDKAHHLAIQKIKSLGLGKLMKISPNSFSSGQKKKILLAQALMHDPNLLIMDEPVANLDPESRLDFFEDIRKLRDRGKSIFISSHVLAELDRYFDAVTILDHGKVVFSGRKEDLLQKLNQGHHVISTKNNKKVESYFHSHHISFKKSGLDFIVRFKDDNQMLKFQEAMAKAKNTLLSFAYQKLTLEDIYQTTVISKDKNRKKAK